MTRMISDQSVNSVPSNADAKAVKISVAAGDGIGPEIMDATLLILKAAQAPLELEHVQIGKAIFEQGETSGISQEAWSSIRDTRLMLKGPITTPQGGGYKSLNVTLRKSLGLFANVRPCVSLHPYVETRFPNMDVTIIRENEEDTYAGIEHRQTREVTQCLKLITRPGCERIVRYAFEYARQHGRKRVTCFSKDNIHKITDGLFHQVFDEIAPQYPEIESDHWIIDIGTALLADDPERFDVIVAQNLYGDIISDVAAQVAGSVGMGGSANIGDGVAMFEAIHGSAPDIASKDIANPSGLINAAIMMLVHLGFNEHAERVQNAWLRTLEDGIHTADIYNEESSRQKVGTHAFARAVAERLGQKPEHLPAASYESSQQDHEAVSAAVVEPKQEVKELVGVDVFLDWNHGQRNPEVLGHKLEQYPNTSLKLKMITNRGVKVYPNGLPETFCTDHWRCRFVSKDDGPVGPRSVVTLLSDLCEAGFDVIKTENLYTFDGVRGYSLGQGE